MTQQTTELRLSVVVPIYNEAAAIAGVVDDLVSTLRPVGLAFEIVAVNDASTDGTREILSRLAVDVPELRVVDHPENQGWARTSRSGIRSARGELIAHFAGDGEARAADLLKMLGAIEQGADIVLGVRGDLDYTPFRRLQHYGQNLLVRLLFGLNFADTGGPKLARAHIWKSLPGQDDSAIFITERLLVARRSGVRIESMPVAHRWRKSGKSAFSNPRRSIEALRDLVALRLSPRSRVRMKFEDMSRAAETGGHAA